MISLQARIKRFCSSDFTGKCIFLLLLICTGIAVAFPRGIAALPSDPKASGPDKKVTASNGPVKLSATLSQTKLVQGADGTFYAEISIEPPASDSPRLQHTPVDLVVVLDRSGSMAADNRLPFAKSAIQEVLTRLTEEDRFGLVTFDTMANIVSPLSQVTESYRSQQRSLVNSLTPAGSTNLSGGLTYAREMLAAASPGRVRKVILLSDGEANVGIVDPSSLALMVRGMSKTETIVSTIGMGLGFNEVLMASLADNGMGNYAYLEHLPALGEILQKELESSRSIYASSSSLEVAIPNGVELIDSSGYPREPGKSSHHVRLLTGQLLSGGKKTFFLTFRAPTNKLETFPLGDIELQYTASGEPSVVRLSDTSLAMTVVEPAKESEALASVDGAVFKKSWIANNLGRIQQEMSSEIRAGNAPAAQEALRKYETELSVAEKRYKIGLVDAGKNGAAVAQMKETVNDLMSSSGAERDEKSKRAAKDIQSQAFSNSRSH